MTPIPFFNYPKLFKENEKQLVRIFTKVASKGAYILQSELNEFENKLAKFTGSKFAVGVANATDGLQMALMAGNLQKNSEVIVSSHTMVATASAIHFAGGIPVPVEAGEDLNIDVSSIEKAITRKTKAIMPTHLNGRTCKMDEINKIAKKYSLDIYEDAAQSFGASFKGQKSCSFGDVAATSFYPAKPLGCYGDGGAIFTNDVDLAQIYKSIRIHGQGANKYDNVRIGLNSRLDTFQAIILIHKLKIFNKELELRNDIAKYYSDNLESYVEIPLIEKDNISSWAQYSVRVRNNREKMIKILNDNNIPTAIFYEKPFNSLAIYKELSFGNYNVSENTSNTIFSIPMHPYLNKEDLNNIINIIQIFFQND